MTMTSRRIGRIKIAPLSELESVLVARMRAFDAASLARPRLVESAFVKMGDVTIGNACEALRLLVMDPAIAPAHFASARAPIATASESNARASVFLDRHRRSSEMRRVLPLILRTSMRPRVASPARFTIVREGVSELDDDNLRGALKSARDAVAVDYMGLDDADPRLLFRYEQKVCARGEEGVKVYAEWGWGGAVAVRSAT